MVRRLAEYLSPRPVLRTSTPNSPSTAVARGRATTRAARRRGSRHSCNPVACSRPRTPAARRCRTRDDGRDNLSRVELFLRNRVHPRPLRLPRVRPAAQRPRPRGRDWHWATGPVVGGAMCHRHGSRGPRHPQVGGICHCPRRVASTRGPNPAAGTAPSHWRDRPARGASRGGFRRARESAVPLAPCRLGGGQRPAPEQHRDPRCRSHAGDLHGVSQQDHRHPVQHRCRLPASAHVPGKGPADLLEQCRAAGCSWCDWGDRPRRAQGWHGTHRRDGCDGCDRSRRAQG